MDRPNHDLLLAVLAIMTDAIPRPALAEALRGWTERRGESLAHWLRESAGLDDQRIHALECLASAHLEAHQYNVRRSLSAWNALKLTQGVLTDIQDDALRTTLGALVSGDETVPLNGVATAGTGLAFPNAIPAAGDGGRFRLLRPHAQGGIGQVWVARDNELQRDVALKEIQPRHAAREDQRARFVLEAEITGNLEHPGIVPVYSLGRNADGQPYYAMRFIRGESFAVAIRRFHERRREARAGSSAPGRPLVGIEFRQLIRRYLDVCDAIEYAHSRGVIHRDLKPANVMLGRYGETLVVDWGLAKVIGKSDLIETVDEGAFEPRFPGASVTASGDTQPGSSIGTPAYMSPEQARGDLDALGPASDVYSLGVTLYELLTGALPYAGKRLSEVVERVLEGNFRHPRELDSSIPLPLEAICLKAMAALPEGRYGTVGALAGDLEHWLADEPVAAYRERGFERLSRWLRQHRTWTNAAAAALVGISVAATIAAVFVEQLRRGEATARLEAESNFKMAQSAVDDYLTSVSENTLLKQQDSVDIRALRQELLNHALLYHKSFVTQRCHDPLLRRQLASAYFRVGAITREIGSLANALDAFQSSRALWDQLVTADPENQELKGQLANCLLAIGNLQSVTDDLRGAMASLNEARRMLEVLVRDHPEELSYRSSLAGCFLRIGVIEQERTRPGDKSIETLERAKVIQDGLIMRRPGKLADQILLAEISLALGTACYQVRDYTAAHRGFQEAKRICQAQVDLITAGSKPVRLLDILAISHYNSATIERAQGRFEEALTSFERSLEFRSALAEAHPSVAQFQEQLGKNLAELALMEHEAHRDQKAAASIKRSMEILEPLVMARPDQPRLRHDLGRSWNIQGFLQDEIRQNTQAIESFNKAVDSESRAIAAAPEVALYKVELCRILDNLGEQYLDLGDVPRALPHYRREIAIFEDLVASRPDSPDHVLTLVDAIAKMATIERHAGDPSAAIESLKRAENALERLEDPSGKPRARFGAILTAHAAAAADLRQTDVAITLLQRAFAMFSGLDPSTETDDQTREFRGDALRERARVLRAKGRIEEARASEEDWTALWKDQPPARLAALAVKETSQALLIGYGKTPITDGGRALRELELDRAAALLRLAISLGFRDIEPLRQNPDSWALLQRPDLTTVFKSLEPSPSDAQPNR